MGGGDRPKAPPDSARKDANLDRYDEDGKPLPPKPAPRKRSLWERFWDWLKRVFGGNETDKGERARERKQERDEERRDDEHRHH